MLYKKILEAASYKTAAVKTPTTHLEDHPNQMNKTCRTLLDEQGRTHKQCSPMDPLHTNAKV